MAEQNQEVVKRGIASNYAIRLAFQTAFGRKMEHARGGYDGASKALTTRLPLDKATTLLATFDRPEMKFPADPNHPRRAKEGVNTPCYVIRWDDNLPKGLADDEEAFLSQGEWGTLEVGKAERLLQALVGRGFTKITTATRYVDTTAQG